MPATKPPKLSLPSTPLLLLKAWQTQAKQTKQHSDKLHVGSMSRNNTSISTKLESEDRFLGSSETINVHHRWLKRTRHSPQKQHTGAAIEIPDTRPWLTLHSHVFSCLASLTVRVLWGTNKIWSWPSSLRSQTPANRWKHLEGDLEHQRTQ